MDCSTQLRRYLQARRSGMTMMSAAVFAPIGIGEARLHEVAEAAGEYAGIITDEMPSQTFQQPIEAAAVTAPSQRPETGVNGVLDQGAVITAPMDGTASPTTGDTKMARRPRKADQVEQVIAPDFDLAVKIYHGDIKPAASKVGEHAQEMSEAYKAIKKRANIQPQAAKLAFKLDQMEESKRDDFLRSLKGLLVKLRIFMPTDLVDQAEGKGAANEEVVPTASRAAPRLATVPYSGDNADLAGEAAAVH